MELNKSQLLQDCRKRILKYVKSVEDAIESGLISDRRMLRYLIKKDFKELYKKDGKYSKESSKTNIARILADKYSLSEASIMKDIYDRDIKR